MFATLAGDYPAPVVTGRPGSRARRRAVRAVIEEQVAAGLGLLSDGGVGFAHVGGTASLDPTARAVVEALFRSSGGAAGPGRDAVPGRDASRSLHWSGPITVAAWGMANEAAAAIGGLPVKQRLPGPYSLGRRLASDWSEREALTDALAIALAAEVAALGRAGCPFVQLDENDAIEIGTDEAERALFRSAQATLLGTNETAGSVGAVRAARAPVGAGEGEGQGRGARPHLCLAISGGNADAAGPETIFAAPWDSHFFDLLAGPDNWRLIVAAPPERGIVCGVVDARSEQADELEIIVWAAAYAASTGGRGDVRVGLAPSGSLAGLPRDVARQKIELLGRAASLIQRRHEEPLAAALDPRAVDIRSAGLGRWTPGTKRGGPTR